MVSRFQSMVAWSHCFGPVARQNIMAGNMWWRKPFASWWPGSKEKESKEQGAHITLRGISPMT